MSRQHNKVEKRNRANRRIKRQKAAVKAVIAGAKRAKKV